VEPTGNNIFNKTARQYQMILMSVTGEEEPPTKQSVSKDRNGFHFLVSEFTMPEDIWGLDPQSKRTVTICNLFVNHDYGVFDIAREVNENRRVVIHLLLKQGIIRKRRVRQTRPPEEVERRKLFIRKEGLS
jgi:hypothetical protein